jgi:tRNA(Ile)-lysidine synthase
LHVVTPAYRTTLLRASQNAAEAARLLDELATNDAQFSAQGIKLEALRALPLARAKNVIRYFLAARGILMPSSKRLTECVRQLRQSRALRFCIDFGAHELLRSGDEIRLVRKHCPRLLTFRAPGAARHRCTCRNSAAPLS